MRHHWGDLCYGFVQPGGSLKLQEYPGVNRWCLPIARERRTSYVKTFGSRFKDPGSREWESRFSKSRTWFTLDLEESLVVRSYARAYLFEFVDLDVAITDRTRFRDLASRISELGSQNPGVNVWFTVEPFSRLNSRGFPAVLAVLRQFIREGKLTLVVCESDLTLPDGERVFIETKIATD